jgi:hypothetical protein
MVAIDDPTDVVNHHGMVLGGVLVDIVDGDLEVLYRRHSADWLRIVPTSEGQAGTTGDLVGPSPRARTSSPGREQKRRRAHAANRATKTRPPRRYPLLNHCGTLPQSPIGDIAIEDVLHDPEMLPSAQLLPAAIAAGPPL